LYIKFIDIFVTNHLNKDQKFPTATKTVQVEENPEKNDI